jgi:drug/metabolite transporter (DMT)-like permease
MSTALQSHFGMDFPPQSFDVLSPISMKPAYLILLIVMNCFWAGSLSIFKALEGQLHPGGVVTLRFGVGAAIMLLAWPWLPGKCPRGVDLVRTIVMGLIVFTLGHRLQVYGNKLGTAGNSSVLMGMEPILTSVAAALFLREHIGPRRWTGFALGLVGVALLNGLLRPDFQWIGLVPSLIFISSFLCESVYSIVGKPLIERGSMFKIIAVSMTVGTIGNLLIDGRQTIAEAGAMPAHFWWMILYLSTLCTAFGYSVWYLVIRETDVNVTALTIFVQPVAGVAIASLWLHEPLHLGQLWGSLAIIAGLILGLSRQIKTNIGAPSPSRTTP